MDVTQAEQKPIRTFVSLSLPQERRERLLKLLDNMRSQGALKGRPVRAENLHLTLAFIGDMMLPAARRLATRIATIEPVMLRFEFSHTGAFRSGILWAGLEEKAVIEALAERVRQILDEEGISYDKKPFRAHVTLARAWRGSVPVHLRDLHSGKLGEPQPPLLPAKPVLMQTIWLDTGGVRYEAVMPA